jgi:hypothetical protein
MGTGPIFGGWDGLEAASAASAVSPAGGEQRMSTAEPGEFNFDLRLEHKLQTAMRRRRVAQPRFCSMPTMRRDPLQRFCRCQRTTRTVPAALIPIGLAGALATLGAGLVEDMPSETSSLRTPWHRSGPKAALPWLPALSLFGKPIGHTHRKAVTRTPPELFTVSRSFLRPRMPNWQVACGIYPQSGRILPYWRGFWPRD